MYDPVKDIKTKCHSFQLYLRVRVSRKHSQTERDRQTETDRQTEPNRQTETDRHRQKHNRNSGVGRGGVSGG